MEERLKYGLGEIAKHFNRSPEELDRNALVEMHANEEECSLRFSANRLLCAFLSTNPWKALR